MTPPPNAFKHWIKEKTTLLGLTLTASALIGCYMGAFSSFIASQMLMPVPCLLVPQSDQGQQALSAIFTAAIAIISRKRK